MLPINFETKVKKIDKQTIIIIPLNESKKLSSRGMVMVTGTVNDLSIQVPLEPDGKGSHWFKINPTTLQSIKAKAGDKVKITFEPVSDWPEPEIPNDLKTALSNNLQARNIWLSTTPIARWDWIRWINSTKNTDTRKKRIETACSKLKSGMKRPCCFNRAMCTDPSISKNGVLLETS